MKRLGVLCFFWGLLLGSHPVLAEESWHFRLSPYVWFAGLEGDVATIPGLPSAPIDISASDALQDTEASVMVILDGKKGRHGFFVDLLYSDVRSDEDLIPAIGLTLRTTTKSTLFTLAYQYEIYNQDHVVIDLLAGARYWAIDSKLRFSSGLGGPLDGRTITNDESWLDPMVGFKARAPIGDSRFYVSGGAGLGGFGVASDFFYEISANVGYQWNDAIGTSIGYRMFDVDYENDGYVYDMKQQGWQAGLTWSF